MRYRRLYLVGATASALLPAALLCYWIRITNRVAEKKSGTSPSLTSAASMTTFADSKRAPAALKGGGGARGGLSGLEQAATPELSQKHSPQNEDRSPSEGRSLGEAMSELRQAIVDGPYGKMPIHRLVNAAVRAQGRELETVYLSLAIRKAEALPLVLQRLREGQVIEKRAMTKVLRYLGWPEALPVLREIIRSDNESPIARIGCLYAIRAIGEQNAAPDVLEVLLDSQRISTEKRIALSTLASLKFREAVPVIQDYAFSSDRLLSLYAIRALSELGGKPGISAALAAARDVDPIIREEACDTLRSLPEQKSMEQLIGIAASDPETSVRRAAQRAIQMRSACDLSDSMKVNYLERLMLEDDYDIASWAVSMLATDCGEEGRRALRRSASERSRIGEKCRFYLIALDGAGPNFRGRY